MFKEFKQKRALGGVGRNGSFQCMGVEVGLLDRGTVTLTGVSTKGIVNGHVEVTKEVAWAMAKHIIEQAGGTVLAPKDEKKLASEEKPV